MIPMPFFAVTETAFCRWWSTSTIVTTHSAKFGRAFVMARSDWEYVLNTFAFGYAVCYHFVRTPNGAMNGNLVGIGGDLCFNHSVLVDDSDPYGLLITNGEFTSWGAHTNWCPTCDVKVRIMQR